MHALGASNKHLIQANLCVRAKAGLIVAYSDNVPPPDLEMREEKSLFRLN